MDVKKDKQEAFNILESFLNMDISITTEVFKKFQKLPGAIYEEDGEDPLKSFLYVPGKRENKIILIAHADTVWDECYRDGEVLENGYLFFEDGLFKTDSDEVGIGADDRAGCAMLWLLRDSGHSLLITGSEEHGQTAAHWLMEEVPEIGDEINQIHQFAVELDVPGYRVYKTYTVGTPEFQKYVAKELGYEFKERSRSDIDAICRDICGTNLSIGYYNNHSAQESLNFSEWYNTLKVVEKWISKADLPRFER